MRTLILLRGAPGSGKSTLVNRLGLENWTLSADSIRLMMQSLVTKPDGTFGISQKNDKMVWDLLFDILEKKMIRGEFVVVDATHSRSQWVTQYKRLVQKYRYRCYCVTMETPLEKILEQNSGRSPLKLVPEDYIKKSYEFIKNDRLQKWIKPISEEELRKMIDLTIDPINLGEYSKIHHIGDLHGCLDPFKEYVDSVGGVKDDEFWIFVGDYIDRGIQNGLLMKYLIDNFMYRGENGLLVKKNVIFLEGNHECWLRMWAENDLDEIRSNEFLYKTSIDLTQNGPNKSDLREFCRRLAQVAYYFYKGRLVFVNHGGHPFPPCQLFATDEYIRGVGKYEDILEVQKAWNEKFPDHCYQVHGHRNVDKNPIQNGKTFNLTENVEEGGRLRVAVLSKDGWETAGIVNKTFRDKSIPQVGENVSSDNIIHDLLSDENIKKKSLGNNVVSFNFSRDVFNDKNWYDITLKARGLFVNVNTGEIVARSWNKFFNIGENDNHTMSALEKRMKFPCRIYQKENGFLGLIGYNKEIDDLFICTKSTNEGEFVEYFKEVLVGYDLEKIKGICRDNNVTLSFEVIHPKDPHIIRYNGMAVYLLNVVYNEFDYKAVPQKRWTELGLDIFPQKKFVTSFTTFEDFKNWYGDIHQNYSYALDGKYVEGFVVECNDNFMFKIKTTYYKTWKCLRGALETLKNGRVYRDGGLFLPEEIRYYHAIKQIPREKLVELDNIIAVRDHILQQSTI
jgi:predicted kinase